VVPVYRKKDTTNQPPPVRSRNTEETRPAGERPRALADPCPAASSVHSGFPGTQSRTKRWRVVFVVDRLLMPSLLAVDLGLRTGLALYGDDGRLRWYRSQNYGSAPRLRRAVPALLREPGLVWVVVEGGGPLGEIWKKEAQRQAIAFRRVSAEMWREDLLLMREQRSGSVAKRNADTVARRVIEWSGAARPTSLRHDAAEAILLGLWAVREVGWLETLPARLRG
jgi:hypothetical protein